MPHSRSHAVIAAALGLLLWARIPSTAEVPTIAVQRLSTRVVVANAPLIGVNNVTAVATRKGLVLIDTAMCPAVARELKREIERQLGRSDWAYVVNTHVHEHTGGNSLFTNLPIIGHVNSVADTKAVVEFLASEEKKAPSLRFVQGKIEELQKQIAGAADGEARGQLALWRALEADVVKGFEVPAPNLRFDDELTLDMGDVTIHALHMGRGHSASDVVVHVPEEKLLVAGGTCGPFFPRIGNEVTLADLERSTAVLDRVLESGVENVVPGHAGPGTRALAEARRDYYRDLLAGVRAARRDGLSLEKAQAALALEQRFPYMREVKVFQGTREDLHAANVAAAYKLLQP